MLKIFRNPIVRQYAVVFAVNLCALATGVGVVWSSPVLVKLSNENQTVLPKPLTPEEGSWVVSIGYLAGVPVNLIIGAFLVDLLGRKNCLVVVCVLKLIAGLLFFFANHLWMLLVGRTLCGIADLINFTVLPSYASEIASKQVRGSLGSIMQIVCSTGIVIMLSVGPFVSYNSLNVLFLSVFVIAIIPLFILPESPYSLYAKGRKEEALKVLTFFRGSEALALQEIHEYDVTTEKNNKISKIELFKDKLFLKTLVRSFGLNIGNQLIGTNAISFYLQTILEATETSIRSEVASVIIGMIQLIAGIVTTLVTDKFGRKPILTVTCCGMSLGMLGLGVFFKLKETNKVEGFMNYLPLISLILFVYCNSAGMGTLNWILNAELFDDRSRGLGTSLAVISASLSVFFVSKYLAQLTTFIGPAITYWIYSANSIVFCLFITFCVPETKGKTFAEIQELLRKF